MSIALRVDTAIREANIPISGVTVSASGSIAVDFKAEATSQQRSQAETIIAGLDLSDSGIAAWQKTKLQDEAKEAFVGDTATRIAAKASDYLLYASIVEIRTKINAIIDHLNGSGAVPSKLTIKTWTEAVAAAKLVIESWKTNPPPDETNILTP